MGIASRISSRSSSTSPRGTTQLEVIGTPRTLLDSGHEFVERLENPGGDLEQERFVLLIRTATTTSSNWLAAPSRPLSPSASTLRRSTAAAPIGFHEPHSRRPAGQGFQPQLAGSGVEVQHAGAFEVPACLQCTEHATQPPEGRRQVGSQKERLRGGLAVLEGRSTNGVRGSGRRLRPAGPI